MPRFRVLIAMLATLSGLVACSSSPTSRFYTLDAVYDGATYPIDELQIGIGPFGLPRYLDRPQFVVRGDGNRLIVSEFDRWADALTDRFDAVLVRNLVIATESPAVLGHPWRRDFSPTYRVTGVVDRFEADGTGNVVLEVRWAVLSDDEKDIEASFRSIYTEAASPGDYNSIAAAMSRTVAAFAADIAADVAARLSN